MGGTTSSPLLPTHVLPQFELPGEVRAWTDLGNAGGFSGAQLWRVDLDGELYCLRRWAPGHPTPDRLTWIHRLQQMAHDAGITQVPAIVPSRDKSTYVLADHALWELTRWMPGRADFQLRPSRQRLIAAVDLLARLHQAIAPLAATQPNVPSATVAQRLEYAQWLIATGVPRLRHVLRQAPADPLSEFAQRLIADFSSVAPQVIEQLTAWRRVAVRHQACLRDIWHDHVLFEQDEVTGIVDYGAARIETPLLDLARLTGSLIGDDAVEWRAAVECYLACWPALQASWELCGVFDAASALLSGMQWLDWLFLQQRAFDDPQKVWSRLQENGVRLGQLVQRGGRPALPSLTVGW